MTIEETIGAALEARLAPINGELRRLTAAIEALRRAQPPALMTVADAAKALGVSIQTVRRRVHDRSLPSRRVGRSVRVDLSALHVLPEADIIDLAARAQSARE